MHAKNLDQAVAGKDQQGLLEQAPKGSRSKLSSLDGSMRCYPGEGGHLRVPCALRGCSAENPCPC